MCHCLLCVRGLCVCVCVTCAGVRVGVCVVGKREYAFGERERIKKKEEKGRKEGIGRKSK